DTTVMIWDMTAATALAPPLDKLRKDPAECWRALASEDAASAFRAVWALVAGGEKSVAFVGGKVRPVATGEEERIRQLIADLDSDQLATRDSASKQLEKLGTAAGPLLRQARRSQPSLEARRRIDDLLERITEKKAPTTPDQLRLLRAVQMLEYAGTPEARDALAAVAEGANSVYLADEARAALARLERRR